MVKKSIFEQITSQELAPLWHVFTPAEQKMVTENFTVHQFRKNQIIYGETEDPENLWILLKGKVKMYKSGIGERVQILRLFCPVQYFGYRAWFAGEPYMSSACAFEPSQVGVLPMKVVDELIRNNPQVGMFFIHELSRRLGGSDAKIVSLTQKHLRGRLADALLLLADNYGLEDDEATLKIYLSREDLANLSNMTTSNAIRTLTSFVGEKLVLVDGRRIKIINEAQLRKISKYG